MNRNEVEQWMKESLEKRDYAPTEDTWKKLQEAIVPPAKKNRVWFLGSLSGGWKAAASLALVVVAASVTYLVRNDVGKSVNNISVVSEKGPQASPVVVPEGPETSVSNEILVINEPDAKVNRTGINVTARDNEGATMPLANETSPTGPSPVEETLESGNLVPEQRQDMKIGVSPKEETRAEKPVNRSPQIAQDLVKPERVYNNSLNVGIAAQAGSASVGNMRYQVGIVARKNLSEKFYTSATVSLASTNVSAAEQNTFPVVSMVSFGSSVDADITEKSVEAQYGKDILAIGVSPNIGYRLTRRLAVTAGVAVYRNLDQSLSLTNEGEIDVATLSNNVISTSQTISQWDAGVTGSASYNVSKKLAVDVQYRYGLSNYLYSDGEGVRNSGLGIGLNYMFGKQ